MICDKNHLFLIVSIRVNQSLSVLQWTPQFQNDQYLFIEWLSGCTKNDEASRTMKYIAINTPGLTLGIWIGGRGPEDSGDGRLLYKLK